MLIKALYCLPLGTPLPPLHYHLCCFLCQECSSLSFFFFLSCQLPSLSAVSSRVHPEPLFPCPWSESSSLVTPTQWCLHYLLPPILAWSCQGWSHLLLAPVGPCTQQCLAHSMSSVRGHPGQRRRDRQACQQGKLRHYVHQRAHSIGAIPMPWLSPAPGFSSSFPKPARDRRFLGS